MNKLKTLSGAQLKYIAFTTMLIEMCIRDRCTTPPSNAGPAAPAPQRRKSLFPITSSPLVPMSKKTLIPSDVYKRQMLILLRSVFQIPELSAGLHAPSYNSKYTDNFLPVFWLMLFSNLSLQLPMKITVWKMCIRDSLYSVFLQYRCSCIHPYT